MLKSITTSDKISTKVQYDFSNFLQDIKSLDREINIQIQKYEECQSRSIKQASQIRSR